MPLTMKKRYVPVKKPNSKLIIFLKKDFKSLPPYIVASNDYFMFFGLPYLDRDKKIMITLYKALKRGKACLRLFVFQMKKKIL
jgi:hypothetical protein